MMVAKNPTISADASISTMSVVTSAIPDSLSLSEVFMDRSRVVIYPFVRVIYLYRSTNDRLRRLTCEFSVL